YLASSALAGMFFTIAFTMNMVYQVKVAHLDPLQLVLVGTALEISVFLFEIPTGVVADVISRRTSVIIGFAVMGLGFLLEGSFPIWIAILLAQVIWGLGYTFISGAMTAWITDEVGEAAAGSLFLKANQVTRVFEIFAIFISVGLASIRLNFPLLATGGGFLLLSMFLLLVMPEDGFEPTPEEDRETFNQLKMTLSKGFQLFRERRSLFNYFWIMLFYGLASEGYDRLQTIHFLEDIGFPVVFGQTFSDEVWFGAISVIGALLSIGFTALLRKKLDLSDQQMVVKVLMLMLVVVTLGMMVFALTDHPAVAMAMVLVVGMLRGNTSPLENAWINQHIRSDVRATVLSMSEQANSFGQMVGGPVVGVIGREVSVTAALLISGALHFVPAWLYHRSRKDLETHKVESPG
ncbi:MAG: MFS transporter, partial [Anaerolineaceae bacterium]|nr:MFS transporter [Anaerolineaceae bacterium]